VAAGDAHRVWFPEMVEHLRLRWRDDLSMAALLGLRDELDDVLGRIRSTRHIANPVFKCPACGLDHLPKDGGLDLYGHAATSEPVRLPACAHADER
jgi:hypothetical protein